MKTLALFSKPDSPQAWGVLNEVARWAHLKGLRTLVAERDAGWTGAGWDRNYCAKVVAEADIAIAIGGDGTLLGVARELFGSPIPLLGVNLGTLGYLTDVSARDIEAMLDALIAQNYTLEQRILLQAELTQSPNNNPTAPAPTVDLGFNDVVLRSRNGRLAQYDVFVDGKALFSLKADGLIITTPTGSTAYALSAQGPILHPSLAAIAIVPLCPHSLTARPITLPSSVCIEVIPRGNAVSRVYCDGQAAATELTDQDRLVVSQASSTVPMLHLHDYDLFNTLRQKLNWGTPREV